jgi:hypothetical protein
MARGPRGRPRVACGWPAEVVVEVLETPSPTAGRYSLDQRILKALVMHTIDPRGLLLPFFNGCHSLLNAADISRCVRAARLESSE